MISVWNIIMSATSGKSFLWRNTVDMQEWLFANRDAASNVLTHWNQTKPCMATWLTCDNDERWIQSLKGVNCTFNLHKRLVFHGLLTLIRLLLCPIRNGILGCTLPAIIITLISFIFIKQRKHYTNVIYVFICSGFVSMAPIRYIPVSDVSMDLSERHNWQETWL